MKKHKRPVAALILALLLAGTALGAERRIRFQRGQTTAEVTGRFTAKNSESLYVILASKGKHMTVEIQPLTKELITAGTVQSPSGKYDGSPGGVIYDSDLPESGDYHIRIFQRQEHTPGLFRLRIDIK